MGADRSCACTGGDAAGASDAGDGCYYGVQLSSDGIVTDLLPLTYIPNGGKVDFQHFPAQQLGKARRRH